VGPESRFLGQIKRRAGLAPADSLELSAFRSVLSFPKNINGHVDRGLGKYDLHQFGVNESEDRTQGLMSCLEFVKCAAEEFLVEITLNLQEQGKVVDDAVRPSGVLDPCPLIGKPSRHSECILNRQMRIALSNSGEKDIPGCSGLVVWGRSHRAVQVS
jgi:hypothetical protein